MSRLARYVGLLLVAGLVLGACVSTDPPPSTEGAAPTTDAPETTVAGEAETSDDTALIVLLIAGVLAIGLLIGWIVARNRNDPPEDQESHNPSASA